MAHSGTRTRPLDLVVGGCPLQNYYLGQGPRPGGARCTSESVGPSEVAARARAMLWEDAENVPIRTLKVSPKRAKIEARAGPIWHYVAQEHPLHVVVGGSPPLPGRGRLGYHKHSCSRMHSLSSK